MRQQLIDNQVHDAHQLIDNKKFHFKFTYNGAFNLSLNNFHLIQSDDYYVVLAMMWKTVAEILAGTSWFCQN